MLELEIMAQEATLELVSLRLLETERGAGARRRLPADSAGEVATEERGPDPLADAETPANREAQGVSKKPAQPTLAHPASHGGTLSPGAKRASSH